MRARLIERDRKAEPAVVERTGRRYGLMSAFTIVHHRTAEWAGRRLHESYRREDGRATHIRPHVRIEIWCIGFSCYTVIRKFECTQAGLEMKASANFTVACLIVAWVFAWALPHIW